MYFSRRSFSESPAILVWSIEQAQFEVSIKDEQDATVATVLLDEYEADVYCLCLCGVRNAGMTSAKQQYIYITVQS